MLRHSVCGRMDVASRGIDGNKLFFEKMGAKTMYGTQVHAMFSYREDAYFFKKNLTKLALRDFDVVLVRLPHPVPEGFWTFLEVVFKHAVIINHPRGIEAVGRKTFMLNFPNVCPPMQRCTSIEDVESFRQKFPIVLKPVKSYSGKGIVKIAGDKVSIVGGKKMGYRGFLKTKYDTNFDYLGVQFLKNVELGSKRIVVCKGEIVGATLYIPKKGSWVCNASQGARSLAAPVDMEEVAIVKLIDPVLLKHGVVFYSIDTLVNDEGKRVLSGINTASVGNNIRVEGYNNRQVAEKTAALLWDYFVSNS